MKHWNKIEYRNIIWLLAVTETLHNLEEAIWFPAWLKAAGTRIPAVGAIEFRFSVVFVTILIYGVIYYFSKTNHIFSNYLMGGTLGAILLNVFFPHVIGSIVTFNYVPGGLTGLLLNLPVILYLMKRGIKEHFFTKKILLIGSVACVIVIYPMLMLSFALARIFFN